MRFTDHTRARQIQIVAIVAPAILLSACVTDRRAHPAVAYPAASFEYQLPVTTAKVAADLVLESCDGDHPLATPTITITPVANPNPNREQRFLPRATA